MSVVASIIEAGEVLKHSGGVIFDCRFSLADVGEGESLYLQGHIPGAYYLHLERHLSGSLLQNGGRHPLPAADTFVKLLASYGVGPATDVVVYDDHRFAYAARLWWMMTSLGYKPPRILNGGYRAWLASGGVAQTVVPNLPSRSVGTGSSATYRRQCDILGLRAAQDAGCTLVDSREERRYQGLEEPIDPVAGHIPAAVNRPWQGVTDSAGRFLAAHQQKAHWGELLDHDQLVVYCGSGVTACVNLFSLASLGRDDAVLYAGSWSDWCSHLQA